MKSLTTLHIQVVSFLSVTSEGLTVLDLAVILRNRPLVKLLLAHGATENQYCEFYLLKMFGVHTRYQME